jgi:2'-5' RNA ligase
MPYAITLCLDDPAPIQTMLDLLAARGIADDRIRLGYHPHVTLGLYPDDADETTLQARLGALSGPAVELSVPALGVFPGPPAVLYAAPCPSAALLALHAACASAHPHYQPGRWMPHITLSEAVADVGPALAAWRPFRTLCSTAELVRFRPVVVLAARELR